MIGKRLVFAITVGFISLTGYLLLPSSYYNTDGLRVFSSLHYVKVDSLGRRDYLPRSWRTGYQEPYFFLQNVQKHLLFPLYAFFGYRCASLFGYQGSGLKPVQVTNALCAGIALGLFAFLVCGRVNSSGLTIGITGGLAFSHAFSSMATNIAEVVPAIPWLILGLILIEKEKPLLAGLVIGISSAHYLVSLVVAIFLGSGLFFFQNFRKAFLFLLTAIFVTIGFYVGILLLARGSGFQDLFSTLTFVPEQGTFGGFKASNLITMFLGLTNSIFPVLPDDFSGVKNFIALGGYRIYLLGAALLFGIAIFFFSLVTEISDRCEGKRPLWLLVFLAALITAIFWAPYHPKIWMYANLGLWLGVTSWVKIPTEARGPKTGLRSSVFGLFCLLVWGVNICWLLAQAGINPKLSSAREIAQIVTNGGCQGKLVIGDWEPEFCYLTLFLPESSLVSLPDLILQNGKDSAQTWDEIEVLTTDFLNNGGKLYFVNLFNYPGEKLRMFYAQRLQAGWFLSWVKRYRPLIRLIWQDEKTKVALFQNAAR